MLGSTITGILQTLAYHQYNKARRDFLMSMPEALAAYSDCEDHFNQALAAPRGIAITLGSAEAATRYAHKLNSYRSKIRKKNRSVYPPDHPSYGTSPFDALQVGKDKDHPERVLIRPYQTPVVGVEPL